MHNNKYIVNSTLPFDTLDKKYELLFFIMLAYLILLKLESARLSFIYLLKLNPILVGVPKAEIAKARSV